MQVVVVVEDLGRVGAGPGSDSKMGGAGLEAGSRSSGRAGGRHTAACSHSNRQRSQTSSSSRDEEKDRGSSGAVRLTHPGWPQCAGPP